KLLRDIKSLWRVSLLISILISPTDFSHAGDFSGACAELDKSRQLYKKIENAILELGLDNVWEMKPLVNGKEIMSILKLKTGGPKVREWQEKSLEWQLAHPSASAEECQDWMRQEWEARTHSKRAKLEELQNLE
ncbi:Polynucleotide adenylyltransferase family protein, partial [Thalictrum thalictroides]